MKKKRLLCLFLTILMVASMLLGCTKSENPEAKEESNAASTLSDLSDKKIGVMTGSVLAILLPDLIPDATFLEFNNYADVITAFHSKKIDTFSTDESIYKAMLWEGQSVDRIDEAVAPSDYGLIFGKGKNLELQEEMKAYIAKIKEDGTHKILEEKWFGDKEPTEFETYDDLKAVNGTLKIGINSASKPFVYEKNGKYTGFEVEVLIGFCKEYGYGVEFEDAAFSSVLAGVAAEKYDIGMSGITITDERKESVDFSDVLHTEDLVMVIHKEANEKKTVDDYKTANVGVTTGTYGATLIYDLFPEANIKEFSSITDLMLAVSQNKVDICLNDSSIYTCMKWDDIELDRLEEPYELSNYGIAFKKGENVEIQKQLNEYIVKIKENGEYNRLQAKWFGDTEPVEFSDYNNLTGTNGTLKVAICNEAKPFGYIKNSELVGYDVDILAGFAKEYGYALEIEGVAFPVVLSGLQAGLYDLAAAGLTITEERSEIMDFTDPYHQEEMIYIISPNTNTSGESRIDFMESLKLSFEKTFIREQRWKLIVSGVWTTITISVFAVLGGTLLGFGLYMLARSKYELVSKLTKGVVKVYSTIIAGTPTLVVLMILFYVIFTSPDISGVFVAIVGFALTFGSYVYENLSLTVSGVDRGQLEAAYALGYSRNQAFFRIILPQAMKMFVPGYSGEIVNLIKSTSVVGYIAVNDLTKMGDIIRGNTYEAFFPLIAVAVIYFAITWIITMLLNILKKRIEPKRRKNKNILKGVVR